MLNSLTIEKCHGKNCEVVDKGGEKKEGIEVILIKLKASGSYCYRGQEVAARR